jgi:hypothetical protein
MGLNRRCVEETQLYAVIVSKPGLDVEFLAFAPGGRPAVFWTRSLAEGWLEELRRQRVIADGRVERWQVKRVGQ